MEKLSSLLLLLSLVTTNIYVAKSYTITASVLNQLGYNNQSKYVNLNDNGIDKIDPNAFNGYDKLITFDILSNSVTAIDIEVFKDTVNLKNLYIECRSLSKLTNSKNIKLPSVTYFYLVNNITSFNKAMFNAFPSLESFQTGPISGTKTIDVHTFESLSNLIFLSPRYNLLTGFEYLQIPKNLKVLNLDYNNMNYFALSRTMGVLDVLRIDHNLFRSFKSMDFTFLVNLTELYLSHNPHAYPNEIPGHLKPLVKLRRVGLASLNITTIDSNYFKFNTQLQQIDLSNNKISSLDNRAFNGLNDLNTVLLGYNNLTKISSGTFSNAYLTTVELGGNQISQIEEFSFRGAYYYTYVNLNNNKLTKILPRTFYSKFSYIGLGYNQITEIENSTFEGVSEIKHLDLSNNKIGKLAPGSFNNLGIDNLDLSNNNLTELRNMTFVGQIGNLRLINNKIENIEEGALNYASITDSVYFYNNSLTEIKHNVFSGQNELRRIYLHNNKLSTIEPGSFANLPKLMYVFLDNNQLTQLDSSMFAGSNHLYGISVSGNPNLSTANIQSLCPPAATNCHVYL